MATRSLEVANTILDLNPNWPLGSDGLVDGDDHIRMIKEVLQAAYPVGSVLYNTTGTNPGTYIGGTWVAYAEGRAIVGVGGTWTGGEERGSETHTLTEGEIPSHTHGAGSLSAATAGSHSHTYTDLGDTPLAAGSSISAGSFALTASGRTTNPAGDHTHTVTGSTAAAGSGGAHNNVQPSIGTYAWERTA